MENNEKNFQNGVSDVEQNVDNFNGRTNILTKTGKGKTIALVVIVLILMLVIGVFVGILISDKGTTIINKTEEKAKVETKKEDKNETKTIVEENNVSENKKIEENETKDKTENETKNEKKGISKINLSDEDLVYAVSELNDFSNGMKLPTDDYIFVAYNMINDKRVKAENDSDLVGVIGVSESEINSIIYSIFGVKLNEHGSYGNVLKYENGQYILEKSDRGSRQVIKNINTDIAAGTKYITYDYYTKDNTGKETYRGRFQLAVSNTDGYVVSKKAISLNNVGGSKIIKKLSPEGWAGSSMQEIRLYDNGDVYHVTYNGEGNTEANVVGFELIAKNVDSIEEKVNGQVFEGIVIKGKNVNKVRENVESWIVFEND